MSSIPLPQSRREVLKARSRRSILEAASALVLERHGPHFTVEELAERADVSRATVFNYFPSVSEVLLTASVEKFDLISETFADTTHAAPKSDGSRAAVFEEVVRSVRQVDLLDVAVSVGAFLGLGEQISAKQQASMWQVLERTSANFADHVAARYPGWERLEVDLLVGTLMNGITIALGHWLKSFEGEPTEHSRAAWNLALDRVITGARSGYGSSA